MTHRRLKIFACLLVICGFFVACQASHAQTLCSTLSANPSQSTIQNALNSCSSAHPSGGGYVQGVAGTTSISGSLSIPCGILLIGPNVPYSNTANQTMVLNGGGSISEQVSLNGSCSSGYSTGIEYVLMTNGGGVFIGNGGHTNVIVNHNGFTSMPDAQTPCQAGTYKGVSYTYAQNCTYSNSTGTGPAGHPNGTTNTTFALYVEEGSGGATVVNGLLFEYNNVSDLNSCVNTASRTYVSWGGDGSGGPTGCGLEILAQSSAATAIQNVVIRYNHFGFTDEGIHVYGTGYTTSTIPANNCNSCDIEYNWFEGARRIGIEYQAETNANPLIISNNVFNNPRNTNFNSYVISTPCCQTGTELNTPSGVPNPSYYFQNNIEIAPIPSSNSWQTTCAAGGPGCVVFQWANEYWGNGSLANYNLLQGLICTGFVVGYKGTVPINAQYNSLESPTMNGTTSCYISNNGAAQGPGNFFGNETGCSGGCAKDYSAVITPNTENATPASVQSVAPTISPASGAYNSPPTVTLTDPGYTAQSSYWPHGNTSVWYTTDGSTPVPGSSNLYTAPFQITLPTTIKAVGMWGNANQPTSYPANYGFTPSGVVTATYSSTGGTVLNSVSLSTAGNVTTLTAGQTVQLNATCNYSNGATTNCNSTDSFGNSVSSWTSSSSALTVSSSGLVTAVSAGSANFIATVSGQQSSPYTITSTVPTISLTGVSLATAGNIISLAAGAVNQLTATCSYSNSTTTNCSTTDANGNVVNQWTSSMPSVATVSSSGLVTAVSGGSTNLTATVGEPQASALGQSTQSNTYANNPNYFNATYVVPPSAGGIVSTCSIYLPAATQTNGGLVDCGIRMAPTPTTVASTWLCYATYTNSSATGPGAYVTLPLTGCGNITSPFWIGSDTNAATSSLGYYNCGSSCTGAAPTSQGTGTYQGYYQAATYGTYTGLGTTMSPGSPVQLSAYVGFQANGGTTSNTVPLTVTASAPTLQSVALTAPGSPTNLTIGSTLQFSATCTYSNAATTNCTTTDTYGNAVSSWASSAPSNISISTSGLAKSLATGATVITANVGTIASSGYNLTATAVAVTLTGITLNTTNGVTGLFVGATNQLVATCLYSDGSTTNCTAADSRGNVASNYLSSNPTAATVSSSGGLVTGVAPGATNLTATSGGKTSPSKSLTVLAVPTGLYTITISGPVKFSGTVQF